MPKLELPSRYTEMLAGIEAREVNFGAGGLLLFDIDELPAGQVGYSVDKDGRSLRGSKAGQWKPSWLAIGYDTGVGDPLILDTGDATLPVLTSMHGECEWDPHVIAVTVEAFAKCFSEFAAVANGRSNPVAKSGNPLSDAEGEAFRTAIIAINAGKVETDFWDSLLAY